MMTFRILSILLCLFVVAGCASKKKAQQRYTFCPEIYVLDKTDKIEKAAPGFERTNRKLYKVAFGEVTHQCDVNKKSIKVRLEITLDYEKNKDFQSIPQDFQIFLSLLDENKKLIMREYVSYQPREWRKSNKFTITDKIELSYTNEAHQKYQPRFIYLGFKSGKDAFLAVKSDNN